MERQVEASRRRAAREWSEKARVIGNPEKKKRALCVLEPIRPLTAAWRLRSLDAGSVLRASGGGLQP
jgi:hypothetical protein